MKIINKSIDAVSIDPANERLHPDKNMDAIKGSLLKFGQQKPIVIDEKGIILAGNGTYAAAKALGWDKIKVVVSDLSGLDKAGYRLADNRTSELAEWDDDALGKTLQYLYEEDYSIVDIGFDVGDWGNPDSAKTVTSSKELDPNDFDNFDNICPKCGFEWNDKK